MGKRTAGSEKTYREIPSRGAAAGGKHHRGAGPWCHREWACGVGGYTTGQSVQTDLHGTVETILRSDGDRDRAAPALRESQRTRGKCEREISLRNGRLRIRGCGASATTKTKGQEQNAAETQCGRPVAHCREPALRRKLDSRREMQHAHAPGWEESPAQSISQPCEYVSSR